MTKANYKTECTVPDRSRPKPVGTACVLTNSSCHPGPSGLWGAWWRKAWFSLFSWTAPCRMCLCLSIAKGTAVWNCDPHKGGGAKRLRQWFQVLWSLFEALGPANSKQELFGFFSLCAKKFPRHCGHSAWAFSLSFSHPPSLSLPSSFLLLFLPSFIPSFHSFFLSQETEES